ICGLIQWPGGWYSAGEKNKVRLIGLLHDLVYTCSHTPLDGRYSRENPYRSSPVGRLNKFRYKIARRPNRGSTRTDAGTHLRLHQANASYRHGRLPDTRIREPAKY